jgi:hypothetical protein
MKSPYFWIWNVHRETAHQNPLWAQNVYNHKNVKITYYIITLHFDVKHTYGKVKITSLHVLEAGINKSNQRQNIGMPGCQKYLKSEIDIVTDFIKALLVSSLVDTF